MTDTFRCGCAVNATHRDERCDAHRYQACHLLADPAAPECPPCARNRWLSISLASKATPTRTRRGE